LSVALVRRLPTIAEVVNAFDDLDRPVEVAVPSLPLALR
jgi:hypothetical protein